MTYISSDLRRLVIQRARRCCEYCLFGQDDSAFSFHVEHIIAEKLGGATEASNLALSCPQCNSYKGSDLSSIDWDGTRDVIPLFNPRKQQWAEHFRLQGPVIQPLTPEGRVTVFLLRLNSPDRLVERALLVQLERYPCARPGTSA